MKSWCCWLKVWAIATWWSGKCWIAMNMATSRSTESESSSSGSWDLGNLHHWFGQTDQCHKRMWRNFWIPTANKKKFGGQSKLLTAGTWQRPLKILWRLLVWILWNITSLLTWAALPQESLVTRTVADDFFSKQLLHNETMISQVQSSISFQVLFKMKLLLSNCPADIQWRGMKLLLSNCPKGKILLPLILTFRFPSRSPRGYMLDVCPCLTRSRAGSGGYWMTWKNRFMNTQEILRLMGVLNIHEMEGVVRPRSLRLIAGNAIPIPLVARVLRSMLNSVSL